MALIIPEKNVYYKAKLWKVETLLLNAVLSLIDVINFYVYTECPLEDAANHHSVIYSLILKNKKLNKIRKKESKIQI